MNHARRLVPAALVACLVGAAGCSQTKTPPPPSAVAQPSAVVAYGGHLFVSSLASDGLQVVDIVRTDTDYGTFLRAPDPLFPLTIPTVRRPTTLAKIDQSGDRPLLISGSSLDSQLRFVDANALRGIGAPVALPGRPLTIRVGPDGTTLYVLVARPDDGSGDPQIVQVTPKAAVLDPKASVSDGAQVATVTDEVPVPGIDPGGMALTEAGGSLEAWVSDLSSPQVLRVDLATGAHSSVDSGVRLGELLASPVLADPAAPEQLPAGAYVYGIGVEKPDLVAFDVAAGQVADPQYLNGQVLPMQLPQMPTAMTAMSMAELTISSTIALAKTLKTVDVPILVMVPLLDGTVAYVDGYDMVPVDTDADLQAIPSLSVSPAVSTTDANGNPSANLDMTAPVVVTRKNPQYDPGNIYSRPYIPDVSMTEGVTRSRVWTVGWHVKLPEQDKVLGRVVTGSGTAYVVPLTAVPDLGTRVQPGDRLTITSWHGTDVPQGCDAYTNGDPTYNITAVDQGLGRITIAAQADGDPLPTRSCFSEPFVYSITASGFTLTASDMSTLWRLTPGETFRWQGSHFLSTTPLYIGPDFVFTLSTEQDPTQMADGATRKLTVSSGLDPVVASPDVQTLKIVGGFIPGQPTAVPSGTGYRQGRLYVPYTGSGVVISFDVGSRGAQDLLQ